MINRAVFFISSSFSPHPPPFVSRRRGAVLRGYWPWMSWLTDVRPVRWNTWCRSSSPSSRETSYPCCPKRCEHYTQSEQSVSHVDVPDCDLWERRCGFRLTAWPLNLKPMCFAAGSVRADLPGSQRPAAGCSDLQILEDPGWRQPAVEGEVPRGR